MKGDRIEPFSVVLQETLAEMDEAVRVASTEEAERLELFRLATQKAVLAAQGGLPPRQGHNAYTNEPVQAQPSPAKRLDIRS
jgi:hypothetical protein